MIFIKKYKKKNGFTLIEILVVLCILGLLSSLMVMFVMNSGKMSDKLTKDADEATEARIAMSYVTNLLHQNDVSNAISVKADGTLEIKHGSGLTDITQIYYNPTTKDIIEATNGISSSIAKVSNFTVQYEDLKDSNAAAAIQVDVTYVDVNDNNTLKTLSQKITLKSVNYTVGG